MTTSGTDLLKLLGGLAAPGAGSTPAGSASPTGSVDFASLLQRAATGEATSGRPVSIAKGAGVDLTEDQLSRLAAAADKAEAQGATRALVLIDGKALTIDIAVRQVTGAADLGAGVLTGIDAVVSVPGKDAAVSARPSHAGMSGEALLRALTTTRHDSSAA
jgi:hypothetical protein